MSIKERQRGTVRWFNNEKGFGFIQNEQCEDFFVHHRSIQGDGFKTLAVGQPVMFTQVKGEKGWQAVEVEVLETA